MCNIDSLRLTTILLLVLTACDQINCGRVLIIGITPSFSHQSIFHGLSSALSKRGHEVVLVTSNPKKNLTLANYTEIDLSITYKTLVMYDVNKWVANYKHLSTLYSYSMVHKIVNKVEEYFYTNPEIQKLYAANSKEKFDVVIAEGLAGFAIFALAYKLNAPLISTISEPPQLSHHFTFGSPLLQSHPSNWEFPYSTGENLSLWNRVQNFILMLRILYQWHNEEITKQQVIVRRYLGDDIPSVIDIAKNTSLWLVNSDPVLDYARPLPPNVILYSGLHITEEPPALPTDLRDFLGHATNGFIYMSLGTNVKTNMLSPEAWNGIYNTFSKLPYKVLWKVDTNVLPRRKDNIFTSKWIPQQGVLAHPNIKLFIYQGGLQSTEETIHYSVPVVGIPLIFDQMYRVQRLVALGVGRSLDFYKLNEEVFYEAVTDVINNKSYKTNMMELNKRMRDKPYDTREHAVWWVEYVMRHKGAPHLRFSGVDNPWYQRYDMDVVAFLSIISLVATVVCAIIIIQSIRWSYKYLLPYLTGKVSRTHADKKVK